jgi:hypothetical protein
MEAHSRISLGLLCSIRHGVVVIAEGTYQELEHVFVMHTEEILKVLDRKHNEGIQPYPWLYKLR